MLQEMTKTKNRVKIAPSRRAFLIINTVLLILLAVV